MPFESEKKRPRGVAAASWALAAQRRAGGSPDGKLRKLIDKFEGREAERPSSSKVCTFCGAGGGAHAFNATPERNKRFVLWRDTEEKAASAYYFPGQSRETPPDLFTLVRNKLSPELKKTDYSTPHWSCIDCAFKNRRWFERALERLRRDANRVDALRQVLAVGDLDVRSDLRRARVAALPEPANAVTVEWQPWDGESAGGTHVTRVTRRRLRWELVPTVTLSRILCVPRLANRWAIRVAIRVH